MHDQLCSLVYMASTILHTPATSVRRGNGGGGGGVGQGGPAPTFFVNVRIYGEKPWCGDNP